VQHTRRLTAEESRSPYQAAPLDARRFGDILELARDFDLPYFSCRSLGQSIDETHVAGLLVRSQFLPARGQDIVFAERVAFGTFDDGEDFLSPPRLIDPDDATLFHAGDFGDDVFDLL